MIDLQIFKNTLSHWASGVTVVTTKTGDELVGMTASSFSSVSVSPPQILVCIAQKLHTYQAISASGFFAVNILAVTQVEWGMRFAGMIPGVTDRFQGIPLQTAVTGAPILPDVQGWLDCRVAHAYAGGDHTIFVGEVVAGAVNEAAMPLLYYHRNWRQLAEQIPTQG
ncbi:MAG: flavin reductase [Caldilineaceae bacterium]|nr:flavin reductase [Caldilineaceae bacterium]